MTAAASTRADAEVDADRIVGGLIAFLESGSPPPDLFAPDVFADLTLPTWRVQTGTADDLVRARVRLHPERGQVRVERIEPTEHGIVMQFEEWWGDEAERWSAREIMLVDVADDRVVDLAVYCTGDWDGARRSELAEKAGLIRP